MSKDETPEQGCIELLFRLFTLVLALTIISVAGLALFELNQRVHDLEQKAGIHHTGILDWSLRK